MPSRFSKKGVHMLEDFVELIFEIIFEGVFDASSSKKAPKWLRSLLITIIVAVSGGLFLLFLHIGMQKQDDTLVVTAFLMVFLEIAGFIHAGRKYKK